MLTRTIAATGPQGLPNEQALREASNLLLAGELTVVPTETVYGLAARSESEAAVKRIFEVKGRPADNPLIVHVSSIEQFRAMGKNLSSTALHLATTAWPGPLTLVVECRVGMPWVTAGLDSIAVRMPDHPFLLDLIRRTGPLAAPSANISGRPSPTCTEDVLADLEGKVPLIVDGGPLRFGLESTVLDVRAEVPTLLRPGALSLEEVTELSLQPIATLSGDVHQARSPGMKYRHYSPNAEVWLYTPQATEPGSPGPITRMLVDAEQAEQSGRRVVCLMSQPPQVAPRGVQVMQRPAHPTVFAHELFRTLRALDREGFDLVLVEGTNETGAGLAVMDRLRRCASRIV